MAKDRRKSSQSRQSDRKRIPKKKLSVLTSERITWVDYKDVNLLRRFMSERAKIRARRVTGNSAQQQRAVARAIRIAREMALLPYSVRQVTQRKGGGRRDRDMGREPREPLEPLPTDVAPPPAPGETTPEAEVDAATQELAEAVPAEPAAAAGEEPAGDEQE